MPRKIGFVIGSFTGAGTEHYLVRLLRHLDRERYSPLVVTFDDAGELREAVHSLAPVYVVHLTGKLFNRQGVRELWRLRRWLRDERIELLHALMDRAIVYGGFAAWFAGGVPLVASHRYSVAVIGGGMMALNNFMLRNRAYQVISNSRAVVPWLERIGVPAHRVTVIHNGIPPGRLRPVVERPPAPSPITVCSVGRFDAVKAQHLLIDAIAALVGEGIALKLILVGSGPEERALRRRASDLGIDDRIEWTGYLPDPMDVIRRSDICVLSSYNEGFPNVVVEYFAGGRPVVATAVGGVPEIVRQGENGLLVPPGNADALARALTGLVDNPELRRRMGWNGRALVERELTAEMEVARTQEVYDRVLREHARR